MKKKNMNWFQAQKKYPKINPLKDADRDGVINMHDCKPFNKWQQEIYNLSTLSPSKRRKILNNPQYLYHKTEFSTVPQIIKTNKLQRGNTPLSTSETSNPNVIYKKYKEPVVLVLQKKKLKNLQKINYDDPYRKSTPGSVQFKSEKEWTSSGSQTKEALKGVILNEKIKETMTPENEPGLERVSYRGYPTRYVTPDEFKKRLKFKRQGPEGEAI
jgi:hypothetical protein